MKLAFNLANVCIVAVWLLLYLKCIGATNPLTSLATIAGLGVADQATSQGFSQVGNIVDTVSSSLGLTQVPQARFLSHITNKVFRGQDSGDNPINFLGGNLGSYYNFMYPSNDDFPYACACSEPDLELFRNKQLPYVRCRNQEDLSIQDVQANCNPYNHVNPDL
ncbi:hypothetical protein BdWA1_002648 [Babesia duncani]|uniref:Uncharacterized protein n=1 Tax=Babesia duncani TaxID=323732 RepID=A0AAD9PJL0_9APIC|nr:hypothetical protein BdWA1_002648 [Babesia duncani]